MSIRIGALAACLAIAAPLVASDVCAQTYYIGGQAGWTSLEDQSARATGLPVAHARYDSGYAIGARGGIEWGPWRIEEEYTYRSNDLNHLDAAGISPGVNGSRQSHAIMTNVLYDIDLSRFGWNIGMPITPHVGAGIGAVNLVEHISINGFGRVVNDDDWQFGYQAIGGIRYNVSPNLALDLDYRYLATTDPTFRINGTGVRYQSGYQTHNLMASLVYRFGPPPPPPPVAAPLPPAPPVVERRIFLVFFDWDRDTITPDGTAILQQAANAYKSGAPVRIQVTGYTDTSGSAAYNQRLSERRANNVANALSRLGVPRSDMAVSGRGENDLRVPTADGVREPQNRRVEIVFP
jgi:outer membrane protein OmpA-like peptidoglycan-associated protein